MQSTGRDGEAKYNVQYTNFPVSYDTTLNVLDTDYKSYAVIWSCNSIGPVGHTRNYSPVKICFNALFQNFSCFSLYRICMGYGT